MITLAKPLRVYLVGELRNAATLMEQHAATPTNSVFYFSACYGATQRVLNIEFSEKLGLLHFVLQHAYQEIMARIAALRQGQEQGAQLPDGLFLALAKLVAQLADKLEARQDIISILETIVTVAYSTTGNGFYLYTVGRLKMPQ
ncbi:MAG: hypothetical protein HY533_02855 [Chloroflexi bacterium]|nr:hypothetical protein [Chloroflexota bacterium]